MAARYHVDLKATADKELAKVRGQPKAAERLERAMIALGENPHPAGCTPLKGLSEVWRVRLRDYRICYTVDHSVLIVLALLVHTRGDVYP